MSKTLALNTFFGVKAGMTRIFDEKGNHVPVTVVKLCDTFVSQVKTDAKEGYSSYQIAFNEKKESRLNKPHLGHLKKASLPTFSELREIRVESSDAELLGAQVVFDSFKPSDYVDVTGVSKGKGFQGVIKRFNFSGGPAAHGSKFHRTPGSIGNRATPARVFKNKKLPGHMGSNTKTVQNLVIVKFDFENKYVLIRGSVPGGKNTILEISKSVKK